MPRDRGKPLEDTLNQLHKLWDKTGYAHIIKLAVPMGWDRKNRKPFRKAKTGFDYMGTAASGRSICMEAKTTRKHRLSLSKQGIKPHQVGRLKVHGDAGAIALVYWYREDISESRIIPYSIIWEEYIQGKKSIPWDSLDSGWTIQKNDYLAAYLSWEKQQKRAQTA